MNGRGLSVGRRAFYSHAPADATALPNCARGRGKPIFPSHAQFDNPTRFDGASCYNNNYCAGPNRSWYSCELAKPLTIVRSSVGLADR